MVSGNFSRNVSLKDFNKFFKLSISKSYIPGTFFVFELMSNILLRITL